MSEHAPPTVLIVEDHVATRRFLADNLAADGYRVLEAATADAGRSLIASESLALTVLDLGLPDRDGLDLLAELRGAPSPGLDRELPVLVLSGRTGELDRIRVFRRGGDDFLAKPFSYGELCGRIEAVLRRCRSRPASGCTRVGPLELDPHTRAVRVDGRPVELARKEYALLHALISEPTRAFTREELLRDVWGFRAMGTTRTLDSHASRLRRKLASDQATFVINVWGVGYRLIDSEQDR